MLFNSYTFIFVFLPITFAGFFAIARSSTLLACLWLGTASLIFYGYWNPNFVFLLLLSISFNYLAGYWISRAADPVRRFLLVGAISVNLVLLAYFKYANFFLDALHDLGGQHWQPLDIVLPLGISFFTFTQISFLVDVYRRLAREYNFIHYLLFVTYFPHLIAGPVLHHGQMMPQFADRKVYEIDFDNVAIGSTIFIAGLAKKVLIADNLAPSADSIFNSVQEGIAVTFFDAWAGTLAYTFQLYFDFSGYSDMAIGLALLFNVRLPINFNSPYRALNISDFWRRWHISLSNFLRNYLYIPLGGNRHGEARRYVNLLVTMLLGGLWHGASWTFVVWGGLHGLFLVVHHLWLAFKVLIAWRRAPTRSGQLLAWAVTFLAVCVGWVFFRAASVHDAFALLAGMFGFNGFSVPGDLAQTFLVQDFARLFGIELRSDGFLPLLDADGKLYRDLQIVLPIAALVAFALPLIDAISKELLRFQAGYANNKFEASPIFELAANRYVALAIGLLFGVSLAYIGSDFALPLLPVLV